MQTLECGAVLFRVSKEHGVFICAAILYCQYVVGVLSLFSDWEGTGTVAIITSPGNSCSTDMYGPQRLLTGVDGSSG